ncbi:MAG: hypothetical protein M3133_09895 [Actinomycetota bacterium]|nr:hypothetical protein [Actinomycetota bacterium]
MKGDGTSGGGIGQEAGGLRIVVERGGEASAEELAAISSALTEIVPDRAVSHPAWQRAALREALGAPPARCAADVAEPSPGVPAVLL